MNNELSERFPEYVQIYDEIWHENGVPKGSIKGNGKEAIKYEANGEASDWMLGVHGILALSPELGILNPKSDEFFIEKADILHEVI